MNLHLSQAIKLNVSVKKRLLTHLGTQSFDGKLLIKLKKL